MWFLRDFSSSSSDLFETTKNLCFLEEGKDGDLEVEDDGREKNEERSNESSIEMMMVRMEEGFSLSTLESLRENDIWGLGF